MLTRKTQYAWMSLGGLICLFALVLACKLRDGNKASAQPEPLPPPKVVGMEQWDAPPSPLPSKPSPDSWPSKPSSGPLKVEKDAEKKSDEKPSMPKTTLEMPMPSEPPFAPPSMDAKAPLPPPMSGSVMPASFAPNTPTPPESKTSKEPTTTPLTPPAPSMSPLGPPPPPPTSPQATISIPLEKPATPPPPKKSDSVPGPRWNAPSPVIPASDPPTNDHRDHDGAKSQPGEPPLAPAPGPVQIYHVHSSETLTDISRHTLGSSERAGELQKLNPTLKPDEKLRPGTTVRLPADACVQADDAERVRPLPALRPKPQAPKAKVLPLTGTYQCSVDEKGQLTLPRAIRDQLGGSETVLVSPGPDKCLWLTNQPHLERLGERLDQSQANEADVRVFKRLYFAQTEKLSVNGDGRVSIPERLGQFAGLHQEVVLVGIDDHFEVWDAARWRSYTQQKSVGHSASLSEPE